MAGSQIGANPVRGERKTREQDGLLNWTRTLGVGLGAAAGSYVAISALMARGLTRTERRPLLDSPASLGLDYTDITFRSAGDRLTLSGWLVRPGRAVPDTAIPWVVLVHGHGAHRADPETGALALTRDLTKAGYGVFLFDLRGCGNSPAQPASAGYHEQRDLLGALHYLEALGVSRMNIAVLGFSLGGAVALLACADGKGAAAVIADSPFADLELRVRQGMVGNLMPLKVFEPGMRLMARLIYGIDMKAVSPMQALANTELPVLLIHGDRDEVVPMVHFRLLSRAVDAGTGATWLVDDAGHVEAYRLYPDEYTSRVIEFLKEHLDAAPRPAAGGLENGQADL